MPAYFSPGVYVEEVPSTIKPIAGVSTSTAGFIGIVGDQVDQPLLTVKDFEVGKWGDKIMEFKLPECPQHGAAGIIANYKVNVGDKEVKLNTSDPEARIEEAKGKLRLIFIKEDYQAEQNATILFTYTATFSLVDADEPYLCTNFSEYQQYFGDFSGDDGHRMLTHAVYGFFNNGGSRCYVARAISNTGIQPILNKFEAIDEIAIVAAPGITSTDARSKIDIHCRQDTQDRFAIFDSDGTEGAGNPGLPSNSDFAAYYIPWIQVFDPVENGSIFVPPSGHIAGIYARVDTQRGVHKAPANEPVLGALGLKYRISKAQQEGLNPQGVNCIREMNGNIRVWGARTIGGNDNADLKYINVRRTLLFLRESIEEGLQWAVFESNAPALWQKITRNVTAFLTNVWRSGALFGNTPQEAFYVRCNSETNPPELREAGQVVTEIGVAIVRPAEFVIFRISQWAGPSK